MSNNRFRWDGLEELKAALRQLPEELTGEGSHIVEGAANGAAVDVRSGYAGHRRSGNLQDGVTVEHGVSGFGTSAVVKSNARHAWLFENGSQARHTAIGANRGSMPPAHVFVPAVMRKRRAMYDELKAMLTRHGLLVSGDA